MAAISDSRTLPEDSTDYQSIHKFIQHVKSIGLARTNRYRVEIPLPMGNGDTSRLTSIFCESLALPGTGVMTTAVQIFGEAREMPYQRLYNQISMTFYMDSDVNIKRAFERWMDMVINPTDRTVGYFDTYKRNIDIHVVNVDTTEPYHVTLHDAYPKTIQDIQMSADSREIMKMSVLFQYRYWTTPDTAGTRQGDLNAYQDRQAVNTGTGFPQSAVQTPSNTGPGWFQSGVVV